MAQFSSLLIIEQSRIFRIKRSEPAASRDKQNIPDLFELPVTVQSYCYYTSWEPLWHRDTGKGNTNVKSAGISIRRQGTPGDKDNTGRIRMITQWLQTDTRGRHSTQYMIRSKQYCSRCSRRQDSWRRCLPSCDREMRIWK